MPADCLLGLLILEQSLIESCLRSLCHLELIYVLREEETDFSSDFMIKFGRRIVFEKRNIRISRLLNTSLARCLASSVHILRAPPDSIYVHQASRLSAEILEQEELSIALLCHQEF